MYFADKNSNQKIEYLVRLFSLFYEWQSFWPFCWTDKLVCSAKGDSNKVQHILQNFDGNMLYMSAYRLPNVQAYWGKAFIRSNSLSTPLQWWFGNTRESCIRIWSSLQNPASYRLFQWTLFISICAFIIMCWCTNMCNKTDRNISSVIHA